MKNLFAKMGMSGVEHGQSGANWEDNEYADRREVNADRDLSSFATFISSWERAR